MGMIMDYIFWRGDLSFSDNPVNEIDMLILSLLSYLQFNDIVPGMESNQKISLKETSLRYFSEVQDQQKDPSKSKPTADRSFDFGLLELLRETANCSRFEKVQLSKYAENLDFVVGQQFGAVTFTLPNQRHEKVVAFRGTDNSLIGWKEDFELAYMAQIPAHESACAYLNKMLDVFSSKVNVCGHSKGGNLAVYACSHLNETRRKKISKVINFDGPGFDFSIISSDSFAHCENKVFNYIPEESIVGMLLEPVGKRIIVSSSAHGMNQHNPLNWNVKQSKFIHGKLSKTTELVEHTLRTWLADLPVPKRKLFIEALFDILGASEGKTIDPKESLKETRIILKKYSKLDKETKYLLYEVFFSLNAKSRNAISTTLKARLPKIE